MSDIETELESHPYEYHKLILFLELSYLDEPTYKSPSIKLAEIIGGAA